MFERYTERSKTVMHLANEEANRLNHGSIDTEHILIGILRDGTGMASVALKRLNVDTGALRDELNLAGGAASAKSRLPQTTQTKKVIEYAIEEARNLDHQFVGTEHLLLGLMLVEDGTAARILQSHGVEFASARREVQDLR